MGIHTLNLRDGSQVEVEAPKDTPLAELIRLAQNKTAETRTKEIDAELDARLLVNPIEQAGGPPDKKTAFGRGIARGVDSLQQNLGSAVEGVGSVLGLEGLKEYGAGIALDNEHQLQRAERFSTRLDDVGGIGSGASYVGEIGGESAPQMAQVAVGAALGATIGSAVPVIGTGIGAVVGGALAAFPLFYGSNRERQKDAIDRGLKTEISEGAAALTAIPQAALDSILTTIGAKFLLKPGAEIGGGLLTRATKGAKVGVITEVPTEIGQAVLERAQAGLPLADAEALREYGEAGLAAGILGGGIGATAGAAKRPSGIAQLVENKTGTPETDAQINERLALEAAERGDEDAFNQPDLFPSELEAALNAGVTPTEKAASDTTQEAGLDPEAIIGDDLVTTAEFESELSKQADADAAVEKVKAESDVETITNKRDADRIKQLEDRRKTILQDIIATTDVKKPAAIKAKFEEALSKQGIGKTKATEAELGTIQRASSFARAKGNEDLSLLATDDATREGMGGVNEITADMLPARLQSPKEKGGVDEQTTKAESKTSRGGVRPPSEDVDGASDIDPAGDADAKEGAGGIEPSTDGGLGSPSVVSRQPDGAKRKKPASLDIARVREVLSKAQKLRNAGGAALVTRSGMKALVDAGLIADADASNPITANASVARLLDIGPEGVNAALAEQKTAQLNDFDEFKSEAIKDVGTSVVNNVVLAKEGAIRENVGDEAADAYIAAAEAQAKKNVDSRSKKNVDSVAPTTTPKTESADVRKVMPVLGKKGTALAPEGKAKDVEAKPKQTTVKQRAESAESQKEKVAARKSESKELNAKQAAVYARKPANVQRMGKDLDAEVTIDEFDNTAKKAVLSEMDKTRTKGTPVTNAIQRYFGQFPSFDAALTQAIEDVANGETRTSDSNDLSGNLPQQVMQREFYLADPNNNLPSMGKISGAKVLKWFGVDVTKAGAVRVLPDGKGSKNLKSYIETELNSAITAYANINNRQKASIKQQEQQRRNLKAEKVAEEAERDNAINKVFKLPAELVIDLPLRPQVRKALLAGKLQDALVALQATAGSRATSKLAKTFAENVGNTKLVTKKNLKADDGTPVAGYFDPKTNTIALDAETGINAHALLHEMFHAVTSATIADKSHPLTKKLTKMGAQLLKYTWHLKRLQGRLS